MVELILLAFIVIAFSVWAGRFLVLAGFTLYSLGWLVGIMLLIIGGLKLGFWLGKRKGRRL